MRHFGFLVPRGSGTSASDATVGFPPGDDPAVLVGLSTTYQGQEALFPTIVEALGDLAVRALVTTAGQVNSADLPKPPNVTVTDFVPHTLVLDQTDAMVTHAGAGSIAGALSFGVPLVCIPLGRDQPLNAQRVVELGAGVALTEQPTAAEIAAGIEQLLSTSSYRDAAGALAQASRDEGGAAAAAGELEALLD
jgi:MGT family glycosyltransferase